jgi:hypothetical protein
VQVGNGYNHLKRGKGMIRTPDNVSEESFAGLIRVEV